MLSAALVMGGCAAVREGGGTGGAGGRSTGATGGASVSADAGTADQARGATADAPAGDLSVSDAALGDTACAAESQQAERLPLDLYLMIDSSGSMKDATAGGQTKWAAVTAALRSFIQDPSSAGLGVGLQYFPVIHPNVPAACTQPSDCGAYGPCQGMTTCSNVAAVTGCKSSADCTGGATCIAVGQCLIGGSLCAPVGGTCSATAGDTCAALSNFCAARDACDAPTYAKPDVEVAALPGAAAALMTSLGARGTDGNTPTSGALSGAISHAQALARAAPTHHVAVVLATDGLPTECMPTDIGGIAALASAGRTGTPPVTTYVIGVFSEAEQATAQANLDALASAGGTGSAFVINTGQNVTQSFLAALNTVRTRAVGCSFRVPAPRPGAGALDFKRVNVSFTSGGGQTSTIGYVPNATACDPIKGGWYYDADPSTGGTPQTINTCDATCRLFQSDAAGRVDVLLGCMTQVVIP